MSLLFDPNLLVLVQTPAGLLIEVQNKVKVRASQKSCKLSNLNGERLSAVARLCTPVGAGIQRAVSGAVLLVLQEIDEPEVDPTCCSRLLLVSDWFNCDVKGSN